MENPGDTNTAALLDCTVEIVSNYVGNNPVSTNDLPGLIETVHQTVMKLAEDDPVPEKKEPAVPIKKSVTETHLICLEDGRKLKMLKRYLRSRYNLTPEEYRTKWGLPDDYPMVAPEYAKRRSDFAKEIGLGRVRG